MKTALRLLICEDIEADAAILVREIEHGGYEIFSQTVDSANDFKFALEDGHWDIIISDFNIPGFGGPEALLILKESGQDIPFVLVSGTVGEEIAVNMMKAGSSDYLMKGNLQRLSEVVKRELEEALGRKEKKLALHQLAERKEELKKLSRYLKNAREEERKYISREIHDEIGQLATAAKMELFWINKHPTEKDENNQKHIDRCLEIIDLLITETRKIAGSLRPPKFDDLGLIATMQWQVQQFEKATGISCDFSHSLNDKAIEGEIKTELFRICQESMTNVMRHAKASHLHILLSQDSEGINMEITDDGIGFDQQGYTDHLGLLGMRERAVSVGGQLEIVSSPGNGTRIRVSIPFNFIQGN